MAFFAKALHRRPASRFDTADQMRQAWRAVFAAATRPTSSGDGTSAADPGELDRLLDAVDERTAVADLGLSAAALGALERLGIGTVRQLLDYPTADWNRAAGVGLNVRREVLHVIGGLRERLDVAVGDEEASVDRIATMTLPKPQTPQAQQDLPVLRTLLGFVGGTEMPLPMDDPSLPTWPGPSDVRTVRGLDRADLDACLQRARTRWLKQPAITQARNDLAAMLDRAGGVLAGDELALGLLSRRGSTATGPERLRRARAVIRACLEAESGRDTNRFTWRRLGGGASLVVALNACTEDGEDGLDGEELADYAATLATAADQLAAAEPLATPAAAIERLRRIPPPAGMPPLSDQRLTRLAAAASATASVSSRLELYPRGLSPRRAVRIARAALLGSGTLSEQEVRDRVNTRLPDAAPLPDRPELDDILRTEVGLEWSNDRASPSGAPRTPGFRVPPPPVATNRTAIAASGTRYRTGTATNATDEDRARAELTDERLRRHVANGGYLVLTVAPNHQDRAIRALAGHGATVVDLDEQLIDAMHAEAEAKRIDWDRAVLATDASGPTGPNWQRLLTIARSAAGNLADRLRSSGEHVLLSHPGLLARYDQFGLLDQLREQTTRIALPGQMLKTLWVLVPSEDPNAAPALAGRAIPITTNSEHLALPEVWLNNLHRTVETPTGAPR